MSSQQRNALPIGTQLQNYRIEGILGSGGFGITYMGIEANTERRVAIKEYLPSGIAMRDSGNNTVHPIGPKEEQDFDWGMSRFLQEAKVLINLHHPNIVPVLAFFEAHGTCYLVMTYQDGRSLEDMLLEKGRLTQEQIDQILPPLMDGLAAVHAQGYLHRDIKPSNVYVREDGSPVLLDFGAARQALGQHSMSLTAIISEGYAPYEQYEAEGNQGPWTDIYALGGVLYRCIAGRKPVEAPSRLSARVKGKPDPLPLLAGDPALDAYRPEMLAATDYALRPIETERPQDLAAFRTAFEGQGEAVPDADATMVQRTAAAPLGDMTRPPKTATAAESGGISPSSSPDETRTTPSRSHPYGGGAGSKKNRKLLIWGLLAALLLVGGAAGAYVAFSPAGMTEEEREAKRRAEEEARRQKVLEEKRKKEEAERQRLAEEEKRKKEEAERRRLAEEEKRKQEEAERRRKAEEERRKAEEVRRKKEEAARNKEKAVTVPSRVALSPKANTAYLYWAHGSADLTDTAKRALQTLISRSRGKKVRFVSVVAYGDIFEGTTAEWRALQSRRRAVVAQMLSGLGRVIQRSAGGKPGARYRLTVASVTFDTRGTTPPDTNGKDPDGTKTDGAAALRKTLTDAQITVQKPQETTLFRFLGGGRLTGSRSESVGGGAAGGTTYSNDSGTWTVRGNRLCTKWRSWEQGRTQCYTAQKLGERHYRFNGGGLLAGKQVKR